MLRFNANLYRIAFSCSSTEATRYYLDGVFVEPHAAGGVKLTATDGHRMLCIHDETGEADESAIIKLSPEAFKACKPGKRENRREVRVDGASATIQAFMSDKDEIGEAVAISASCRVDGTFPDYRRVIPVPAEFDGDSAPAAFRYDQIDVFAKVAVDLASGSKVASVRIISSQLTAPALVLFPLSPNAFGVVMPIKVADASRAIPAWFSQVAA